MKILVYGAGVLGSLYAAKLQASGQDVTILARGQRANDLREHGILLQDALKNGPVECVPVKVIDHLETTDPYDLVLVLVRYPDLPGVLPELAVSRSTPNLLFMTNNPGGTHEIARQIARERVLLGFPGAGGTRDGELVRYAFVGNVQHTTLGELSGLRTPRLDRIARVFEQAGFRVAVCHDMDAWLKTHAAMVTPIADAIYLAGGSVRRLAHTRDGLTLLVRAVRENFLVLRAAGVPVTPGRLMLLQYAPEPLLVWFLSRFLDTRMAELAMEQHANVARADEMPAMAAELQALARRARLHTPSVAALAAYRKPQQIALPEGSKTLSLDWRGTLLTAWVVLAALRLARFFRSRK